MEMNSRPEELDELDRRIMQLEIEQAAIRREKDEVKLSAIAAELANLKESRSQVEARWLTEKNIVDDIQKTLSHIEDLKFQSSEAERNADYARVAEIRYSLLKEAQDHIN